MEVGSPEWIEASLAKLEELEQERAEHEQAIEKVKEPMALRRHTDALSRLDTEIKSLYAQLEAVADDGEEEEEEQEREEEEDRQASAPPAPAPPAPTTAPAFAPATGSAPAPRAMDPSFAEPSMSMSSYEDDAPKSGAGKWVALGLLLVGGIAVGGWFMTQNKEPEAKPPTPGEAQVIKASEVPDDTEAPKAAKGVEGVDKTPIDEMDGKKGGGGGGGGGGGKKTPKDDKDTIKLGQTDDPLG